MLYFQYNAELDYSCNSGVGFTQCPQGSWGAVCVSGDTDGDGIEDCFDPCPCVAGTDCPFFTSAPADETIQCNQAPTGSPTQRNDFCGSSRSSTGFLNTPQETTNATAQCPQNFYRTWTLTDLCSGATQSVTDYVTQISSCDPAVTGEESGAYAVITDVADWGFDGAGNPQYLASVTVYFTEAVGDWRVGIQLPGPGDHVVAYGNYYSVYDGGVYSCGTISPPAFTVAPSGSWSAAVAAGGSVTFEYVATNQNNEGAYIIASSILTVYTTANS